MLIWIGESVADGMGMGRGQQLFNKTTPSKLHNSKSITFHALEEEEMRFK